MDKINALINNIEKIIVGKRNTNEYGMLFSKGI